MVRPFIVYFKLCKEDIAIMYKYPTTDKGRILRCLLVILN